MIDNINQYIGKLALVCEKRPLQYATITSIALTALSLLATTILMSNGIWLGVAICVLSSVVCVLGTAVFFLILHARAQAIDQFARRFPVFRNGMRISIRNLRNLTDAQRRQVVEEISKLPGDWTLKIDHQCLRNLPTLLRKKNLTVRERYELGTNIARVDPLFAHDVLSEMKKIPDFVSQVFPKKSASKEKVFTDARRNRMVDSFLEEMEKLGCNGLNRSEILSGKLDLSEFISVVSIKKLILAAAKLPFLKELIIGGIWSSIIPSEIGQLTELTTLTLSERVYLPVEILNLQKLSKITFHLDEFDDVANKIRGISEEASPDLIYEMSCLFDRIAHSTLEQEVLDTLMRKNRNVSIQTIAKFDPIQICRSDSEFEVTANQIIGDESIPFQLRLRWKFSLAGDREDLLLEVEREAEGFPYWQLKARIKRLSRQALDGHLPKPSAG